LKQKNRLKTSIYYLKTLTLVIFLIALGSGWTPAAAHPHVWIDLRSTVVLNAKGHVTAIEQEWLFDPFYTVFATEGLSGTAEALNLLASESLQNLRSHDYFTAVRVNGTKATLGAVSEFASELREGRLWMRFVLPLATAVDPTEQALTFAVFDPTYYIEILHLQDDVVAFRGADAAGCSSLIVPPTPTLESVMLSRAMDLDAEPDTALGGVFAERVEVTCQ
jgi:ABC-type uncharacterized transport system substrate-binding protein